MNAPGNPDFTPSPIEASQAVQQPPVPSTSREPLQSIPPPTRPPAQPYNQFRSRLVTKRVREIPVNESRPTKKRKREEVMESSSDSELDLMKVIQQTHKENVQNKDAKAVAGMVETFLVDNPKIIPEFRFDICKLIVSYEGKVRNNNDNDEDSSE